MKDFYYARNDPQPFTINELLHQITDWVKKNKTKPKKIVLPVDEYYHLALWLKESADDLHFLGLPVEFTLEEQKSPFFTG